MSRHPDADEQQRRREEMAAQQAAASNMAQHATQQLEELQSAEFLDKLSDPEVDSEFFPHLESLLGPEMARPLMLANEGKEEFNRHFWLNENLAERIIAEHNPGRLCKGPVAAVAQGVHRTDQPVNVEFTDQERRMVWDASKVKTALQSLAIGNRGLKAVTESTAVTRKEGSDEQEQGRMGAAFSRVFGK